MKATILVDNIPGKTGTCRNGQCCGCHTELKGEWGLAAYIEYEGKNILLDTGASSLFLENAEILGLDISVVDMAALSHAHYDHANGMEAFFRTNSAARFYLQETADDTCYEKKGLFRKYIGTPRGVMDKYENRLVRVNGDTEVLPGMWIIPHKTPELSEIGRNEKMYLKEASGWRPDDFSHEQSLVFSTSRGLVIFNSCCHGGAANVINEVADTFPEEKVYGIIGGFHLYNKSDDQVRHLGRLIRETGIEYVCTGHCTGARGLDILEEELGDKLHRLHTGLVMEF